MDSKMLKAILSCDDEATLREINNIVFKKLKSYASLKQTTALQSFHVGQRVSFITKHGLLVEGKIAKINQKTIDITSGDQLRNQWRVSPTLLHAV